MLIPGLVATAVVKTCYDITKSLELDEKALKKYSKAFEMNEEAKLLVKKKEEFTDKRLANVAKKKRAIIQDTVPRFVEAYGKIQKIEIEDKQKANELALKKSAQDLGVLNTISAISIKKPFTEQELLCGLLLKGIGNVMVMDSKRYLSAANSQVSSANVVYSQAQSIGEVYDAIVARADRISNLLMAMNALFVKSIAQTERVINANGLNVRNYSEYDKGVLMTCVNIAGAVSDIIDVPVVDNNGVLCDSALEMIETGEKYIAKMDHLMQ